jgi:hypothetical protein
MDFPSIHVRSLLPKFTSFFVWLFFCESQNDFIYMTEFRVTIKGHSLVHLHGKKIISGQGYSLSSAHKHQLHELHSSETFWQEHNSRQAARKQKFRKSWKTPFKRDTDAS